MKPRPRPQTRLHIDWTRCDGRGLCTELLPRVFDRDPWGYPLPRSGVREPDISPRALSDARAAVARCPRQALSLHVSSPESDEPAAVTTDNRMS